MGILQSIQGFFYQYYIDPIIYDTGYNPVNTVTWAIILGLCLFGVLKLLDKLDVKADWDFVKAIIPFILAGSTLRVFEDAELFSPPLQYLFITPPIYILMFLITVLLLVLSIGLQKAGYVKDWKKAFGAAGVLWVLANLYILLSYESITSIKALVIIPVLGTALAALVTLVASRTGYTMFTRRVNITILLAHMLDASSTFFGVDILGYYEKHVVPSFLIDLTDTASIMFPLKLMIFIPVIYILDTQFDDDDESKRLRDLVKLTIIVLGLAPATRNTVRMVLGI
ncbi:MAG: DUF63 family protein [ANME-2 cluster archaeon]|nr:DUF63 family protein [ANME-2 cluster archaeon]